MKKVLLTFVFTLVMLLGYSQTANDIKRDSILNEVTSLLSDIRYRMRGIDRYKLYQTEVLSTYLKLDTMTGQIYIIRCSAIENEELCLNSKDLSYNTGCGTFELYPTQSSFFFILLDKVTGRTWQIYHVYNKEECWIRRIY